MKRIITQSWFRGVGSSTLGTRLSRPRSLPAVACLMAVATAPMAAQNGTPAFQTLYRFKGGTDGYSPFGGVVIGSGGVLYGTTFSGNVNFGGTVFSLTPPASPGGSWKETLLYSFQPNGSDASNPGAGVVIGSGGVLYGTTEYGGGGHCGGRTGCGTVFSLTPPPAPGASWTENVLHSFTSGSDGSEPFDSVVIGRGGVLYGTTNRRGTPGYGTVFSLMPPASPGGSWTETVLYSFQGGRQGSQPTAGVVIGAGGALYGTAELGGSPACFAGCGTAFSLTPPASPSGSWTPKLLYSFNAGGFAPGMVIASGGVLYGINASGGTAGYGTVFALTPPASPGGSWTEQVLYNFQGGSDGANATGSLVIGRGGVLYGETYRGGIANDGTVFSLTPPASSGGSWTENLLYSFTGGSDGGFPSGGLAINSSGDLFGTTQGAPGPAPNGTVFRVHP